MGIPNGGPVARWSAKSPLAAGLAIARAVVALAVGLLPFVIAVAVAVMAEPEAEGSDTDRDGAGDRRIRALGLLLVGAPGAVPEAEVDSATDDEAGANVFRRECKPPVLEEAEAVEARRVVLFVAILILDAAVAPVPMAAAGVLAEAPGPPAFNTERFALPAVAEVIAAAPFVGTKTASLRSKVPSTPVFDVLVLVRDKPGWDGGSFPAHTWQTSKSQTLQLQLTCHRIVRFSPVQHGPSMSQCAVLFLVN